MNESEYKTKDIDLVAYLYYYNLPWTDIELRRHKSGKWSETWFIYDNSQDLHNLKLDYLESDYKRIQEIRKEYILPVTR